jgi:hypothetical protein
MAKVGSMADLPMSEVIGGLRALLAAIDAGQIEATDAQRAYLAGAVDTLTAISERSH